MMTETSFQRYCENTSLHGWQYIYVKSSKGWRILWMGMVLSSVIIACCFVFKQTSEFTKATVVTTVDTTTAPLSDVFFPAVTICNINQVKLSLSLFLCTFIEVNPTNSLSLLVFHCFIRATNFWKFVDFLKSLNSTYFLLRTYLEN